MSNTNFVSAANKSEYEVQKAFVSFKTFTTVKIIVSHDVDHLYGLEHWNDRYWPGVWYRVTSSLLRGEINYRTWVSRSWPLQRLQRIEELITFELSLDIHPTFFFGMRNGLRLSYSLQQAKPIIEHLMKSNIPVGVHGMAYNDIEVMRQEKSLFFDLTGAHPVGIRNHYLRMDANTHPYMNELQYTFDSTVYKLAFPYKEGKLWVFPISLMDVTLGIDTSVKEKKERSFEIYYKALELDLPYFVLNFHDVYYSPNYPNEKAWWEWFLTFLRKNHTFISFEKAMIELNQKFERAS
jgi:hypothetical protein